MSSITRLMGNVFPKYMLRRDFLVTAVPPLLLASILYNLQHHNSASNQRTGAGLVLRDSEQSCRLDSSVQNVCQYVEQYCTEFDSDGLIPYFRWYHCASPAARPVILAFMMIWLIVLFTSMAAAAGDFLSVHLEMIVSLIGISETLAGVTIFAFGNGSSDLFSTLAAMNANSGSLAISELFGAAAFITTVVLGLIAIIKPFSVDPKTFVGDVVWFMIAASSLTAFLADGQLILAECLAIIGLYVAFISYSLLRFKKAEQQARLSNIQSSGPEQNTASFSSTDGSEASEVTRLLVSANSSDGSRPSPTDLDTSTALINESYRVCSDCRTDPVAVDVSSPCNDSASVVELVTDHKNVAKICKSLLRIFPSILTWNEQRIAEKTLTIFSLPLLILIGLTTPVDHLPVNQNWTTKSENDAERIASAPNPSSTRHSFLQYFITQNRLMCSQLVLGSQLIAVVITTQVLSLELTKSTVWLGVLGGIVFTIALIILIASTYKQNTVRLLIPTANLTYEFFAFTISLTWIYLTATSAVSLLRTLGFVFKISDAILGATIFAVGNSSNDLVANMAIARRGLPVLAASACFGGPLMNTLLGIGVGALVQVLKSRSKIGNSGSMIYSFDVTPSLFMSAANLLGGLGITLTYAFYNSWRLDRRLGIVLIGFWSVLTTGNVLLTLTVS